MSRTGTSWDLLAAVALVAPLAALAGRRLAVPGALAALAGWVVLLVAGAAPEIGSFTPDALALATAAGTALVAAVLAGRARETAMIVGPLAAAISFGVGLVDAPELGPGPATALVVGAAAFAAGLALGPEPARLFLPAALLAGLRGGAELPDPQAVIGLGLAAGAALLVLPVRIPGRGRLPGAETAALALAALAVAAGPLPAARPAGALLAAAAVLVGASRGRTPASDDATSLPATSPAWPLAATVSRRAPDAVAPATAARPAGAAEQLTGTAEPHSGAAPGPAGVAWPLAAAAPGGAVVATALADVPSPGAPGVGVHLAFAALLLAVAVGLVAHGLRREPAPTSSPAVAAVAGLVAWLVVAPGTWTWAVARPDLLDAWDRAAAVAAATALASGAVLALLGARPDRSGAGVPR